MLSPDLRTLEFHQLLQSEYCELRDRVQEFRYVLLYFKEHPGAGKCVMRLAGVERLNRMAPYIGRKKTMIYYTMLYTIQHNIQYNFIELGPRGTGKSYFYSEFSPYSTLISGGQTSSASLFYNNARKKVGLVGYWDTIAFDEVGNMRVKDPDTIQIMKDFMANGRFSRGAEVIADASMTFIGNLDLGVNEIDLIISDKDKSLPSLDKSYNFEL